MIKYRRKGENMIKDKKVLAVIPARGGSKGIKDKNIVKICGKELINYTIDECKESRYIDKFIVSTDSPKIKEVAERRGAEVPFLRPDYISGDSAKSIDVVLHVIDYMEDNGGEYDFCILLQPTSPLRNAEDIDRALEVFLECSQESLVSVTPVEKSPVIMRSIEGGKMQKVVDFQGNNLRRQELPKYYVFNGAIYINSVEMLRSKRVFVDDDTVPFVMDQEKSIDIDSPKDILIAEYYIKKDGNVNER